MLSRGEGLKIDYIRCKEKKRFLKEDFRSSEENFCRRLWKLESKYNCFEKSFQYAQRDHLINNLL